MSTNPEKAISYILTKPVSEFMDKDEFLRREIERVIKSLRDVLNEKQAPKEELFQWIQSILKRFTSDKGIGSSIIAELEHINQRLTVMINNRRRINVVGQALDQEQEGSLLALPGTAAHAYSDG